MDNSTSSPYRPVELRWKAFKAHLQTEFDELEAEFSKKRDALNEKAKINRNGLDTQSTARQDRIRQDQEVQLSAILARHKQEISDYNAATEEKLRKAQEEALKVHNDELARNKEEEAAIKVEFNERRRQLEEKRKQEREQVKELWFSEMDKQVTSPPSPNSTRFRLDISSSFEGTPSRPGANTPLNPPDFSPITPRHGSPASAAVGSQSILTESKTPPRTFEDPPNRALLREQPRGTPKISTSTTEVAADAPSTAVLGTPPSYDGSNRAPVPQNAPNGFNSSVPSTPKETPRARPRTPATSTPKPPLGALGSSGPNTPHKELAQATSGRQHSGPPNVNLLSTPQMGVTGATYRGLAGAPPKTHATSTPRPPFEVFSSSGLRKPDSEPGQSSKIKNGGTSTASKPGTLQDTVPVTSSKTSGRVQSRTPTAVTPTPASKKPQTALLSTSPAEFLDSPIRAQHAFSLTNPLSSDGHPQGATARLPVETPKFVAVPRNSTIYEHEASSATKVPESLTQDSYVIDSRPPSLSLGEKRKNNLPHKGFSPVERVNEYDDFGVDSEDEPASTKSRSNKRLKSSSSIPKASPVSRNNKVSFQVKSNAKALTSRTGQRPAAVKALVGPRTVPAREMAGEERPALHRNMTGKRTTLSSPTASKKLPGARPQINSGKAQHPGSFGTGKIKQQPLTPPKAVVLNNSPSSRTAPLCQNEPQSIEKHFELDRVCYPSTEHKMFSWLKGEGGNIQYKLVQGDDGRFTAYVNGKLGNRDYGAWMINPKSIRKLEFSYENRLVKITRMWNNDPDAYIFFGFTYGIKEFVQSIIDRAPETTMVKFELGEVPLCMLAR